MNGASCGNCLFSIDAADVKYPEMLRCRRYPPMIIESATKDELASIWPPIRAEAWCGEHQPKPQGMH